MIKDIIPQNKLETLLGDHIKDAIIAINSSEEANKEILLEIFSKDYSPASKEYILSALYPGEYLIDCAKRYLEDNKGLGYADFAKIDMLRLQKELLEKLGVQYNDLGIVKSEHFQYKNKRFGFCRP